MNNIHNFVARQLCEYQSIYPTVAAILDHLLFTIGNGYGIRNGMITDGKRPINLYPKLNKRQWDELIQQCHDKEAQFSLQYARFDDRTEEGKKERLQRLVEDCAKYYPRSVSDADFTEEALLADLHKMNARHDEEFGRGTHTYYLRPYPLSTKYSDVYNLNEQTPRWFLQIALNLCNAWVTFLQEELDSGHVWVPFSQRVKTPEDIQIEETTQELLDEMGLPPAKEYKEPERDYGDEGWTKQHLEMLKELSAKFTKMLEA
jgi:hypothetical protein